MSQYSDPNQHANAGPPRIVRAKTGCFTCRRRRKKCDERKPVCWNCERNQFVCEGYQDRIQWVSHSDMKRRVESQKRGKPRGHPSTPAAAAAAAAATHAPAVAAAAAAVVDVVPQGSSDDMLGILTEAAAGWDASARSDGGSAVSAASVLGEGETQATTDAAAAAAAAAPVQRDRQPSPPPPAYLGSAAYRLRPGMAWSCLPALVEGVNSPMERRLFIHFVSILSPTLVLPSRGGAANPLTHAVVQLALSSQGVMRTLMAVSACHLARMLRASAAACRRRPDDNRQLSQIERGKLELYGDAIRFHSQLVAPLTAGRGRGRQAHEHLSTVFATSMLLCQFDTCDGGALGTWWLHLAAASAMLRQSSPSRRGGAPVMDAAWRPLMDWHSYHDGIAQLFYGGDADGPCCDAGLQAGEDAHDGDAGGRSSGRTADREHSSRNYILICTRDGLLSIIRQVARLRRRAGIVCPFPGRVDPARVRPWYGHGVVDVDALALGIEISADLQAWTFDYRAEQHKVVAECYRWSVFLMLYSIIYPHGRIDDGVIQQALHKGLEWLERLCTTDNAQTCCLLPLFVFGIAATEPGDRDTVLDKAEAYRLWSGLGNVAETSTFLRQWWQRRDAHGNGVNWWDWRMLAVERDVAITVV